MVRGGAVGRLARERPLGDWRGTRSREMGGEGRGGMRGRGCSEAEGEEALVRMLRYLCTFKRSFVSQPHVEVGGRHRNERDDGCKGGCLFYHPTPHHPSPFFGCSSLPPEESHPVLTLCFLLWAEEDQERALSQPIAK